MISKWNQPKLQIWVCFRSTLILSHSPCYLMVTHYPSSLDTTTNQYLRGKCIVLWAPFKIKLMGRVLDLFSCNRGQGSMSEILKVSLFSIIGYFNFVEVRVRSNVRWSECWLSPMSLINHVVRWLYINIFLYFVTLFSLNYDLLFLPVFNLFLAPQSSFSLYSKDKSCILK